MTYGDREVTGCTAKLPLALDLGSNHSSVVVNGVSASVLLLEDSAAVCVDLPLDSELADVVTSLALDLPAELGLELLKDHRVLHTVLLVVALPSAASDSGGLLVKLLLRVCNPLEEFLNLINIFLFFFFFLNLNLWLLRLLGLLFCFLTLFNGFSGLFSLRLCH